MGAEQPTFATIGGEVVTKEQRGKHYVEPRGYAWAPGTGPDGETCGTCKHHVTRHFSKVYHKCELSRTKWTNGRATDILVRAPACKYWEAAEE